MAIQKHFVESTAVMQPGDHVVNIVDLKFGLSKKEKPMLSVVFENAKHQKIRSYFVKELPFHQKALEQLKEACDLDPKSPNEDLLGLQCGIAIDKQPPGPDGKVFMQVVGYGKATDVEGAAAEPKAKVDDLKW